DVCSSDLSRDRLLGVIRDKVTLVAQGKRCEAGPGLLLPPAPRGDSVTFVVDFTCAEAVSDLLIRDDLFDVLGADYHTLARFEAPGFSGQFAFTPETRETRVTLAGAGEGGRGTVSFFMLGIGHILSGYDHLLFLRGPAGARAAASGARPVTPRVQPGGRGWAGVRRRTGAAGAGPATSDTLGGAHGHELVARDPRRRSGAVRRARLPLTGRAVLVSRRPRRTRPRWRPGADTLARNCRRPGCRRPGRSGWRSTRGRDPGDPGRRPSWWTAP